ncbi:uncharacterized protein [Choristoneura fumiferana]|uniref:uncharacterized protein n=1 Tax=Choristoneura fumiferana TaxID=7141 RepID=UPI003D1597D4
MTDSLNYKNFMSDSENKVSNDNQTEEDSDTAEQANPDATIHLHAVEDQETDVRRTVLREEKDDTGERSELDVESNSWNASKRVRHSNQQKNQIHKNPINQRDHNRSKSRTHSNKQKHCLDKINHKRMNRFQIKAQNKYRSHLQHKHHEVQKYLRHRGQIHPKPVQICLKNPKLKNHIHRKDRNQFKWQINPKPYWVCHHKIHIHHLAKSHVKAHSHKANLHHQVHIHLKDLIFQMSILHRGNIQLAEKFRPENHTHHKAHIHQMGHIHHVHLIHHKGHIHHKDPIHQMGRIFPKGHIHPKGRTRLKGRTHLEGRIHHKGLTLRLDRIHLKDQIHPICRTLQMGNIHHKEHIQLKVLNLTDHFKSEGHINPENHIKPEVHGNPQDRLLGRDRIQLKELTHNKEDKAHLQRHLKEGASYIKCQNFFANNWNIFFISAHIHIDWTVLLHELFDKGEDISLQRFMFGTSCVSSDSNSCYNQRLLQNTDSDVLCIDYRPCYICLRHSGTYQIIDNGPANNIGR